MALTGIFLRIKYHVHSVDMIAQDAYILNHDWSVVDSKMDL